MRSWLFPKLNFRLNKFCAIRHPRTVRRSPSPTRSSPSQKGGEGWQGVDAMRQKKVAIEPWLTDARPEVQAFAEKYTRETDLRIADEQRHAETRKALRELEYDDPEGDGSDGGGGPPKPDDPEGSG